MQRFLRHRLWLLWLLLALAACAVAVVFHRLYTMARDEIAAQAASAVAQERARAVDLVSRYAEEVRRTTVAELAGFHVDGLERTLRRWDEANDIVVGTFLWDPQRGPAELVPPPGAMPGAELQALVARLREWRALHPGDPLPASPVGHFRTAAYRLLGNPLFPETALGYQGENLDLLVQAGRAVDPCAGWAGSWADPAAPWMFWYQTGPDTPVRGCYVDVAPLVKRLQADLGAGGKARIVLEPWVSQGADQGQVGAGLPSYRLVVAPGEALRTKVGATRLVGSTGVLLLGLFLGVGVLLTLNTRRSAREAERRISFVAQVSHELRTPLTSIQMFADLLGGDGVDDAKRTRFAGRIGDESRRLGALIERLLAFNALEKGVRQVRCSPVDVAAVVGEVVEEMRATLAAVGLELAVELPATALAAQTDRSALKQALINLFDNAAKYAPNSGPLCVRLSVAENQARIVVHDRGPGIPADIRSRVFDAFVQGGRTLTDKSPGLGLGLGIARGLLRQVSGDLVLLEVAAGAAFEIRLPLAIPNPVSES